jgi:hypothetical protein
LSLREYSITSLRIWWKVEIRDIFTILNQWVGPSGSRNKVLVLWLFRLNWYMLSPHLYQ